MPAKLWDKAGAAGFRSDKDDWETPLPFFKMLNDFYKFTLDACATSHTAKCKKFFTKEDDALSKDWKGHSVFMNPPYGSGIGKWVEKAYLESKKPSTLVVCLLPARTDTRWWHDWCTKASVVLIVKGRLRFSNAKASCPFPSAVVVFEDIDKRLLPAGGESFVRKVHGTITRG